MGSRPKPVWVPEGALWPGLCAPFHWPRCGLGEPSGLAIRIHPFRLLALAAWVAPEGTLQARLAHASVVATWQDAVQEAPGGARLLLEVTAGARQAQFPDGYNPWREGRIGIRVRAPAQEGRANEEVMRTLAAFFRHPAARVHIESGAADARKTVRLMGLDRAAVLAALKEPMEAP